MIPVLLNRGEPSSPKGGENLSFYEVMYIIQPDLDSEELLEAALEKVNSTIEGTGGVILSQKKVGKRRLAYEIDDYKEGMYMLINVQAEQTIVPVLEHFFKVNEGYLRYMILRLDEEQGAQLTKAANAAKMEKNDSADETVEPAGDEVVETKPE